MPSSLWNSGLAKSYTNTLTQEQCISRPKKKTKTKTQVKLHWKMLFTYYHWNDFKNLTNQWLTLKYPRKKFSNLMNVVSYDLFKKLHFRRQQ